ncbi:hypothetical protein [Curtobacterium sp. 9128]|uniref:hypothetical protein n=1 Tax=Curtobacterium sp. 9128 TaxID=1793722 RepID=UPI0011A31397|nr:hypothetical protein [Curtobacterium sp. 9128]
MTSLHIAVVEDGLGSDTAAPPRLDIVSREGTGFDELPGFERYGSALLANDVVAAQRGSVVLIGAEPEPRAALVDACLKQLDHASRGRAGSWADEVARLCDAEDRSSGLFAIRRSDWDRLGGLSEHLPFGFIGDLERRARHAGLPVAQTPGRWGDEAASDDQLAYGLTLLARVSRSREGQAAARKAIKRLIREGRLTRGSAMTDVRAAIIAARDVLFLKSDERGTRR